MHGTAEGGKSIATNHRKPIGFRIMAPMRSCCREPLLDFGFNQCPKNADPMKQDKIGAWKKLLYLSTGGYEFQLIIDAEWIIDPGCSCKRLSSVVYTIYTAYLQLIWMILDETRPMEKSRVMESPFLPITIVP